MSHPTRGAWIEISIECAGGAACTKSHPTRGAWIEIPLPPSGVGVARSHPTRGAWIEIPHTGQIAHPSFGRTPHGVRGLKSGAGRHGGGKSVVAPHTGCVD